MKYIHILAVSVFLTVPGFAARWVPSVDDTPNLHTTGLEITVDFVQPFDGTLNVDLVAMGESKWRAGLTVKNEARLTKTLSVTDFACLDPGKTKEPLRFGYVTAVEVSGTDVKTLAVKWTGNDGVVYPWEKDPDPAGKEAGATWWPGLHRNNAGHFGWRYEPNGLLVNNVSFDSLGRVYYCKRRNPFEVFQFNFRIPDVLPPDRTLIEKKDEETIGKTGLASRREFKVEKNIYQNDNVTADWTSFRWRRTVSTTSGKQFFQELRYSTLGIGLQIETDSPDFSLSFQDGGKTRGPAGMAVRTGRGVRVVTPGPFDPREMTANWLVLLANDGTPEIPVMVVFQHRPERIDWTADELIIHRSGGIGTIGLTTPFGARVLESDTLKRWSNGVPVDAIQKAANLVMAYPWTCREDFAVVGGWVHIKNAFTFLPWQDDWKTKPVAYSPLPPLVAYSVQEGYLPRECVTNVRNMKILTKWGPYLCRAGEEIDYRLPIPDAWDNAPLAVTPGPERQWLAGYLKNAMFRGEIDNLIKDPPAPTIYPHFAHDFLAGGWRAANYLNAADRECFRVNTHKRVQFALFPQDYRLRRDPITGAVYLACTFVWGGPDVVNGDGFADIDYWQGLSIYGIYTQAKHGADWELVARHWPLVRSLASYWEALSSWALMGPGAREAGEMYHGDMATAGYAGLVGFHKLAGRLGTPYQRDLAAYLLAKNAVPMAAKFGFHTYAERLPHQELPASIRRCSGFGETWVASFPFLDPKLKGYEPGDPWWLTGCIGPQSAQPESLDLLVKRCPVDVLKFEDAFIRACPNKVFATHDDIRVMPHVMLRSYLNDAMSRSAEDLLKGYRDTYLLRDAHALAILLARDCPVRLIEWSPAYVRSAVWDDKRGAAITIDVPPSGSRLEVALRPGVRRTLLDGKPVPATPLRTWASWTLFQIEAPSGRHELTIQKEPAASVPSPGPSHVPGDPTERASLR